MQHAFGLQSFWTMRKNQSTWRESGQLQGEQAQAGLSDLSD